MLTTRRSFIAPLGTIASLIKAPIHGRKHKFTHLESHLFRETKRIQTCVRVDHYKYPYLLTLTYMHLAVTVQIAGDSRPNRYYAILHWQKSVICGSALLGRVQGNGIYSVTANGTENTSPVILRIAVIASSRPRAVIVIRS